MTLDRLEVTPLTAVVRDILAERKNGFLTVVAPDNQRATLYWSQGELILAVTSAPEDSLADFLLRRGAISSEAAERIRADDPSQSVARLQTIDADTEHHVNWNSLLREWTLSITTPLFSLQEGTSVFTEETPLDPAQRIFISTPAVIIEGVRSMNNGLLVRRAIGDMNQLIAPAPTPLFDVEHLPLQENERKMVDALSEPEQIGAFLKRFAPDTFTAAKLVIAMLTLGIYAPVTEHRSVGLSETDQAQRDLALLASIGSGDRRSLEVVRLSRQIPQMDYYQLLDVPRAAVRTQIITRGDELLKRYDPATYPPIVREYAATVHRQVEEAASALRDPVKRHEYDRILSRGRREHGLPLQQQLTRRSIAEQNYRKAEELAAMEDYYGAIVMLRQTVNFAPDHANGWFLLGSCQERNPKWRRDAVTSYQKALSIDPNHVQALMSLGDLYKREGLTGRAQSCYEDVLKIEPDNGEAKARLKGLKSKSRD